MSSQPRSRPARSSGVLLDRHQPRRGRMGGVGAAHHPLVALRVPKPDLAGPGARLDLIQRPAPAAAGTPRRASPGAEALAEVVRADRPRQPAQRPLVAHQHPAHRPFQSTIQSPRKRPAPIRRPRGSSTIDAKGAKAATGPGGSSQEATGGHIGGVRSLWWPAGAARHPDACACRGRTLAAWGPFRPCWMSNSTAWPSCKVCSPLACTALMCTNTSSPCSGWMKP
jgi:hypothetical protein